LRRTRLSAAGSPEILQARFLLRALLQYHSRVHATADEENVSCSS
jgi:hypothetical protein